MGYIASVCRRKTQICQLVNWNTDLFLHCHCRQDHMAFFVSHLVKRRPGESGLCVSITGMCVLITSLCVSCVTAGVLRAGRIKQFFVLVGLVN